MMRKLACAAFLAWVCLSANAQEDTVYLDEMMIQENRIRVPFSESNKSISLIRRQNLDQQPVNSLAEALSNVPGIDVRSRGVTGTQADLSIRGSTFDENLVLLNGVKLTDPQTGHHLMNLPVNFQDIQRVEVLKGAAARIYGQNAYAGAINIITKTPDEPVISIAGYGGIGPSDSERVDTTFQHFGTTGISASVSIPGDKHRHYVALGRDASNGHRFNSDFQRNSIFYHGGLDLGEDKLKVQYGYTWREFGANGFYAGNKEREEVRTSVLSADYEVNFDHAFLMTRVYTRFNKDNYVFDFERPGIFHNVHQTNSSGGEIHYSHFNALGNTGIGLEARRESIRGVESEQLASNALLDDDERWNMGFYAEHRYEKGGFSMTPGAYVNWHQDYGWSIYPGIDLGYAFSDHWKLYGNVGRTYRVPTFFDLYYASASAKTYGNPDLQPGVANNYEFGIKYHASVLMAEVNGFMIDGVTSIDWVSAPGNEDVNWQAQNFDNVTKMGTEMRVAIDWAQLNPGSIIRSLDVNYTYIHSDLQNADFKSLYALNNLRDQLNVMVTHKIAGNLHHTITTQFRSRPDVSGADLLNGVRNYDDYWLLDAKLFYKLNNGMLFIEGTNLLDTEYVEVGQVVMPGRWYRAGFQLSVGY